MTKKFFILIVALFIGSFFAKADDNQANALRLTFNDESTFDQYFVNDPVLTYSQDGTKLIVSWFKDQSQEFIISNIKDMTFFYTETPTKLEEVIKPTTPNAKKGIFDLNGRQLQKIEHSGIYIINGEKVNVIM